MSKIFRNAARKIGILAAFALFIVAICAGAKAQVSNPANLNQLLCNGPVGSIAVRYTDRWRCLAPGSAGQLFQSNGPASVGGWYTPSGTGNVQTDGNAAANALPYFSNGTTLAYRTPGGAAFDALLNVTGTGAGTIGFARRTASATYTFAPIAAADIPAFSGSDCSVASGTAAIDCTNEYTRSHSWINVQTFDSGSFGNPISIGPASYSSTPPMINKISLYNSTYGIGVSTNQMDFIGASNAAFAWWAATTKIASLDNSGNFYPASVRPTAPVSVAYGGTGATSGSGTVVDNLSGFSGTGYLARTGAGTYSFSTETQQLDTLGTPAQGQIAYRGASGWALLSAGTSGQFLGTNGGGQNPSWQSPAAPPAGSRVLLNTITISSGAANAQDTSSITGTYREYDIYVEGLTPAATSHCNLTFYKAGAFQTSGYHSLVTGSSDYNGGTAYSGGFSTYVPISANVGTDYVAGADHSYTNSLNATIHIYNPASTNNNPISVSFQQVTYNPSATVYSDQGTSAGYLSAGGALTGFSIQCAGSNLTSGTVRVYGSN